ncbi:MAG: hypothetical protein BGO59_35795 [Spirosoma sp. 48-14]|nr:MAG: hypothetical protein BGO59_35795 [Spirosoma sp. 48-14]
MRQFAVALLLMLLVAKVVIGQPLSPAVYLAPGSTHIGYASCIYSYAKTNQGSVRMTSQNQHIGVVIERISSLFYALDCTDFKLITKKLVRLSSKKLAAFTRQYIPHNRLVYIRQLMRKGHIVTRNQFWKQIQYTLCHESNIALFVKKHSDRFTFERLSDKNLIRAGHQVESK